MCLREAEAAGHRLQAVLCWAWIFLYNTMNWVPLSCVKMPVCHFIITEQDPHEMHQCATERPKRPAADCRPCFAGHESFSITQWLEYHSALFSSALRPAIFVLLALLPKPALYPVPKFTVVPVWLCWFYCNLRAFYSKKKDCIRSALIHLYYVRSVH